MCPQRWQFVSSHPKQEELRDVRALRSSFSLFAAICGDDRHVVTWGNCSVIATGLRDGMGMSGWLFESKDSYLIQEVFGFDNQGSIPLQHQSISVFNWCILHVKRTIMTPETPAVGVSLCVVSMHICSPISSLTLD